ncbi:MAG: DNA cytosine methyltransferase [Thermomicrobiales bacterium]
MEPLQFYDFFAGVGMVDLALRPEWQCVWANDFDSRKAAIYTANHGGDHFHPGDVAEVRGRDLPAPVDMAWASFPCQDLSLAGWRRGMTGGRSGAFWQFYRVMGELHRDGLRPPVIVLENVVGLLQGPDFGSLCEALASLDLQFGALVIDAAMFLPQSRPRVFVVAADRALDSAAFATGAPVAAWTPPSLTNAHDRLPPATRRLWRWWNLPAPNTVLAPAGLLVEDEPEGVRWHSESETARLIGMMSEVNRAKLDTALQSPRREVGFLYRRTRNGQQRAEVRFDGIAGCLRTPTGGSSRQTLMVVDCGKVRSRLLSPREAARFMGIPDDFILPDSYNEAYHAMGDGVATPVVRWLGEHLLKPLALHAAHGTARSEPSGYSIRSESTHA